MAIYGSISAYASHTPPNSVEMEAKEDDGE